MPLFIPGLDEANTKKLAKRLHKALAKQDKTPSLTQLHNLLVQAAGHQDWYTAQQYWKQAQTPQAPGVLLDHMEDIEAAQARFDDYVEEQILKRRFEEEMPEALHLLEQSKDPACCAMGSLDALKESIEALESVASGIGLYRSKLIMQKASDLIYKADRIQVFAEPRLAMERLEPLLRRAEHEMASFFWPHKNHVAPVDGASLLRQHAVLKGPWELLESAIRSAAKMKPTNLSKLEDSQAVASACAWWRNHAPDASKEAQCFDVFLYDPRMEGLQDLSNVESPVMIVDDFVRMGNFALFETPNGALVALVFLKGKSHNTYENGITYLYLSSGQMYYDVWLPSSEVDQSYGTIEGLKRLSETLGKHPHKSRENLTVG